MSTPGKPGRPNTGWEDAFLDALRDSGNITRAAKKAKVSRWQVYRAKRDDETFAADFEEAIQGAVMAMEAEAYRRAVEGTLKPVFHNGEQVGTIREYSDTLLIFLLKAHAPEKYRETVNSNVHHSGAIKHEITGLEDLTDDELDNLAEDAPPAS